MTGWYGGQSCACGRLQRPRQPAWRDAVDCFGNRADVVRRGAAAAADEIEQAGFGELLQRCRSEEHTSELQSLMRISYAVFCLKKKKNNNYIISYTTDTNKNTARDTL